MIMCSVCGHWMLRKYVSDETGMICYYYDYCPHCEALQPNGFDDQGNLVHYCYG